MLALVALISSTTAETGPVHQSTLDLAYSPDGRKLAALDATASTVAFFDPGDRTLRRSVQLAGPPAGLAWSADSQTLFVSESGNSRIAEIRADDGSVVRRLATGRYPAGLALAARRGLLLATDPGLDRLVVIDLGNGQTTASLPSGRQPTRVAVTRDESLAVVTALLPATPASAPDHAAEVTVVDLDSLQVRHRIRLPLGATAVRDVAISADGRRAYVAHVLGRFHLPTTQLDRGWVNTNALSILDPVAGKLVATVLLDHVMEGAADPWGLAIDPDGKRLWVTLSGVHQLAILDLTRLEKLVMENPGALVNDLAALHAADAMRRTDLPAQGPRGIDVTPDGRSLAIASYFSGEVIFTDPDGASPAAVALGPQPEPDLVRRGERIFHDADQAFQGWLSCATCHPDGRSDGLNWDLLNDGIGNPKNTRSMLWSDRTPPVMSLGVRADMPTAAAAGFRHILFAVPEDEDLRAVVAYLRSLEPVVSPHRREDGSLTPAAVRGREIYENEQVGCADCHPAPLFAVETLFNVGTAGPADGGAAAFDTPTLVEGWRNPPYLHHGEAADLRAVLVEHNRDDRHGKTSHLTPAEIDDLVAYLLSL